MTIRHDTQSTLPPLHRCPPPAPHRFRYTLFMSNISLPDRQLMANKRLMGRFDNWVLDNSKSCAAIPPTRVSYQFFCDFCREFVASFVYDNGSTTLPDIRMLPVESITSNDPICKVARGFCKAQDRIYGPVYEIVFIPDGPGGVGGKVDKKLYVLNDSTEYQYMIDMCAARIIQSK